MYDVCKLEIESNRDDAMVKIQQVENWKLEIGNWKLEIQINLIIFSPIDRN